MLGVHQDALEYFLKELLDFVLCTRGYSCGWGMDFSSCHGVCRVSGGGWKMPCSIFSLIYASRLAIEVERL